MLPHSSPRVVEGDIVGAENESVGAAEGHRVDRTESEAKLSNIGGEVFLAMDDSSELQNGDLSGLLPTTALAPEVIDEEEGVSSTSDVINEVNKSDPSDSASVMDTSSKAPYRIDYALSSVVDPAYDEENPPPPAPLGRSGVFIPGEPPETPRVRCTDRVSTFAKALKSFAVEYHMPLLLILALVVGIVFPLPGKALADAQLTGICFPSSNTTAAKGRSCVLNSLSAVCVGLIFIISGLKLDLAKFRRALTAKKEIVLSFALIFGLTGAFGFALAAAPTLEPREFSFGLALFALMPTTMSSCVIIVGYAGGNVALALLLTISSNVLAAALLPVTVSSMVSIFSRGSSTAASVNAVQLCLNLVFQVVVPLVSAVILGKVLFPGTLGAWATRHGHALKVVSATLNAVIPWMRISQNASQFSRTAAVNYLAVLAAGMALHLLFLLISGLCALKLFRMRSLEEGKAVTFVGAQKTLPIALSVLELLPTSVTGDQGLVLVPMVFMYLFQAILDSYVAVKWKNRDHAATTTTV